MSSFSAQALKARARELGFAFAGVTRALPSPTLAAYERWIAAGMHGNMAYMARADRVQRRRDLNAILPGVRALVVVGLDYASSTSPELLNDPARGRIAAYAWGLDYHDVLLPRLAALAEWLAAQARAPSTQRVYVDTGALLERSHAQQAGLGFIGKNTMLIHPRRGSSFFLGEVLTTLEPDAYDLPQWETICGRCTRCIAACPTRAFPAPHVLDARRCISYLTIEHKGIIPRDLRPLMGSWVYGCDVCQDVCPFQRFAAPTRERAFALTSAERAAPALLGLLALDDAAFAERFTGTPIARIKRARLVRNACVAAGNWRSSDALPALERLLRDPLPLIRAHAAWALGRIEGTGALLRALRAREDDPDVLAEIEPGA